jgi:hypothetical protein
MAKKKDTEVTLESLLPEGLTVSPEITAEQREAAVELLSSAKDSAAAIEELQNNVLQLTEQLQTSTTREKNGGKPSFKKGNKTYLVNFGLTMVINEVHTKVTPEMIAEDASIQDMLIESQSGAISAI